jgi:hypothetical protein
MLVKWPSNTNTYKGKEQIEIQEMKKKSIFNDSLCLCAVLLLNVGEQN